MWSVFLLILSYLDRNLVRGNPFDAAEQEGKEMFAMINSTLCARVSIIEENYLYQLSDGIEEVRSLVKQPAGELLDCSVIVDQMQVKSFMHVCRLGLKRQKTDLGLETHFTHFTHMELEDAKFRCQEFHGRSERMDVVSVSVDKSLKRSKRGFTYPGTLWCGAGNMADHYGHLGEFAETDSCCRVHDHCPHVIHPFSTKYGYTNFKWHSISYCDCDNVLKACLRKVNDTSSRVVGQAFFNVLEAPCFEFAYEDQCVERHWYGVCKKYETLPVAVLRESVPYDFGGVAVIDVLTVAPSKPKGLDGSTERENPEGVTQSTVAGSQAGDPEQPSLTNVVTAAEDFIKVLATVSTSQSSSADATKGETQTSEKKKRKNERKRKKRPRGGKGKGKLRKRKQKGDAGAKVGEGPAGNRAEEVIDKSNLIHGEVKNDRMDSFIDSAFDQGGKHEPSNDVMKDEPIKETTDTSVTSPATVLKVPIVQQNGVVTGSKEVVFVSTTASRATLTMPKTKSQRSKTGEGRRRNNNTEIVLNVSPKEKSHSHTTGDLSYASVPPTITITPTAQHEKKLKSHIDEGPVVAAGSAPIVILKTQRSGSKERAEGEGSKTRGKVSNTGPIVELTLRNSIVEDQKVITATGAPTTLSIPMAKAIERQVSQRPEVYGTRTAVRPTAMSSTFSVFKTKRAKDRGQRKRRGKIVLLLSNESPSEDLAPVLATPADTDLLSSPTTVISKPTGWPVLEALTHYIDTWLVSAVTHSPAVTHERHRTKGRNVRKPIKNVMPSAPRDYVGSHNNEPAHEIITLAIPQTAAILSKADENGELTSQNTENTKQELYMSTPITALMSPMQLTIQRAREQFSRKRRRKTALSLRQH